MLRISLQTLRARRATLAGAFVAIWLAVTLAWPPDCSWRARSARRARGASPPPTRSSAPIRPSRSATARTPRASTSSPDRDFPPRSVERAAAVPGVARAVGDIAFPAGAWNAHGQHLDAGRADRLIGHGWDSAALTPYRLTAGRPPSGPRDVVADVRLGTRVGAMLRIVTPAGDARYRVSGLADAAWRGR